MCIDERYSKPPVVYRGPDASKHFMESLLQEEAYIREILNRVEPLVMQIADETHFQNSTHCCICGDVTGKDALKVRDHCHVTGKYRGGAHNSCNLNFQHPKLIPCIFHNLKGFDSSLIMQSLGFYKRKRISVVPHSVQKYISFSLGSLRFLDSFQFLPNSLAGLVDDLVKEDSKHFKTLRKQFPNGERFNLLLRKGVYPYSWVDCESKFESEDLPPRQAFRNDLTKSSISDEDYDHAKAVWNTFQLHNFGSYHDLYLTSDVCQLSDVFEQFRDESLSTYGLDPLHFYTSPGLAWASALKLSKCKLELITQDNADAYLFIEAGIRGRISHVSNRFAKANNKYIPETYDPSKPSSYIMYVDCNNLYGVAMSKSLPVSGFRFLNKQECSDFDVMEADVDGEKGQILEVDLEYPEHLHDLHSVII